MTHVHGVQSEQSLLGLLANNWDSSTTHTPLFLPQMVDALSMLESHSAALTETSASLSESCSVKSHPSANLPTVPEGGSSTIYGRVTASATVAGMVES